MHLSKPEYASYCIVFIMLLTRATQGSVISGCVRSCADARSRSRSIDGEKERDQFLEISALSAAPIELHTKDMHNR